MLADPGGWEADRKDGAVQIMYKFTLYGKYMRKTNTKQCFCGILV